MTSGVSFWSIIDALPKQYSPLWTYIFMVGPFFRQKRSRGTNFSLKIFLGTFFSGPKFQ